MLYIYMGYRNTVDIFFCFLGHSGVSFVEKASEIGPS